MVAIPADRIHKLGVEALGWNSSTVEGKAVIAEDLVLLSRLQRLRIRADTPKSQLDTRKIRSKRSHTSWIRWIRPKAGNLNWRSAMRQQALGEGTERVDSLILIFIFRRIQRI